MDLEELKKRHQDLKGRTDKIFHNMDVITDETERVADVAHNSKQILDELDTEFEKQTGLNGVDVTFLFFATAMQCARIFLMNKLTKIDQAGHGNSNEDALHKFYDKIYKKYQTNALDNPTHLYYSPFNQIISTMGVPYDATASLTEDSVARLLNKGTEWSMDIENLMTENNNLFKGANHRFSTLGHDPVLGLIFGTANILTNTITTVRAPKISTHHIVYDNAYKNPRIATPTSTVVTLNKAIQRFQDDKKSVVAALIKQIIHIGTDLYTPKGIQFPLANLVLSNTNVEKITSYISTGDVIKIGNSAGLALFINFLISTLHTLLYDEEKYSNRDVYNVKTRKIILYSNTIASASNVIWVGGNMIAGNEGAIKELDIGGLIVTIHRLLTDVKFIRKVKEEFVIGGFNKLIQGEELKLEEV